jgi:hypothetical protein
MKKEISDSPLKLNIYVAFKDKQIHKKLFKESWHATRNGWKLSWKLKETWWLIALNELRELPKSEYDKLVVKHKRHLQKQGRRGICAYDQKKFE